MKGPDSLITELPGHDLRYALDTAKINEEIGWRPAIPFEEGLRSAVDWYLENRRWVEDILNGSYREYYRKQYGERLHGSEQ